MKEKKFLQIGILMLAIIVVSGLVIFFTDGSAIQARSDEKKPTIGFVNIQLLFQQHPEKLKAEEFLHEKATEMQQSLEVESQDLSGEEKQELLERYHRELTDLEQELIAGVVAQMDAQIREIAMEAGVTVVLESQNVIYGGLDLTNAVLDRIRGAVQDGNR